MRQLQRISKLVSLEATATQDEATRDEVTQKVKVNSWIYIFKNED